MRLSDGSNVSSNVTKVIIMTNGNVPTKMSPRVVFRSAIVALTTYTVSPNGGVNSPISTAITVTMPNQIRSPPNSVTIGKHNGNRNKEYLLRLI